MGNPIDTPRRCRIAWCAQPHDHTERPHVADLGTFDSGRVTVAVTLLQPEDDGVLGDAVVRIFVDSTDHRQLDEQADIPAEVATVIGDALAGLTLFDVGDFVAALCGVQIILGERDPIPDPMDGPLMVTQSSALQQEADASTHHEENNR